MKKITLFLTVFFLIGLTKLNAQDTIPSCVWGVSTNTGNTMLTEYTGDSIFITLWNPSGGVISPRAYTGLYSVSNDTVFFYENTSPCAATDTGVYIFTLDTTQWRDTLIVTLVNDPCSGRKQWHSPWSRLPCYARNEPLVNTCWTGVDKLSLDMWEMELLEGDSVYLTGLDTSGTITTLRFLAGWYKNSNDRFSVVNIPPHPCGTDTGVYTFTITGNNIFWTLSSDPCAARVAVHTSTHDHYDCANVPIGLIEYKSVGKVVTVYPNPSTNTINIEHLINEFDSETVIELYDIVGNKIIRHSIGISSKRITVNVDYLKTGIYILKVIENNQELVTERVVIRK